MDISRRTLITTGLGAGLVIALPGTAVADQRNSEASLPADPFTLGIASGDPWPDGFVIWTRLALSPLAEDGLGGMPTRTVGVAWEVAEDPAMRRVVQRGVQQAVPASAHSVHVELRGLKPGREYFYRFRAGRHISPVGRTLTSPAWHETPAALAMSFASCAQYEHGFFTAYRRLAEDQPDLVLHLGDYQYEYKKDSYVVGGGNVRDHEGPETVTLEGYASATHSTSPTPTSRPPTPRHHGWWSGMTTKWTTTGRTRCRRMPTPPSSTTPPATSASGGRPHSRPTTRTCRCVHRLFPPEPT